jgi:formylglycine-generating enzyme required for sulfatase activity
MVEGIREKVGRVRAFLHIGHKRLILFALVMVSCAAAVVAEEIKTPAGWKSETKQVKVASPQGDQEKEITYYTNSIGMKLARIPAGEFMMGGDESPEEVARKCDGKAEWFQSEQPQHKVRITRPFYMGACEVTQAQYEAIMGQNPAYLKGQDNPVEMVSWTNATEFCKRLSQKEGMEYRLPTEAEWEYACRAGSTTPFYTGGTISTEQANYDANYTYGNGSKGEYRGKTIAVGGFPPNGFGLYDMHGNVWEWCQDGYDAGYYEKSAAEDPKGPASADSRVLRGGSWLDNPGYARSAYRNWNPPSCWYFPYGCRVVMSAQE